MKQQKKKKQGLEKTIFHIQWKEKLNQLLRWIYKKGQFWQRLTKLREFPVTQQLTKMSDFLMEFGAD